MNKDLALKDDKERYARLMECEQIIANARHRGLTAVLEIATQLEIIDREELYRDLGYQSVNQYAEKHLGISRQTVTRYLSDARTMKVLRENNLPLPENESQVAELNRLGKDRSGKVSVEKIPVFWQQMLDEQERLERPLTREIVRQEVRKALPPQPRGGVKTALDEEPEKETGDNGEVVKIKTRISLSEKGEAALERIRRHAGDAYANAIEDMTVPISERDLCKWADQEDWMLKKLGYYLVDQRWSLFQALKYEAQAISAQTTVQELLVMAKFAQTPGELDVRFQDARILVTIED
jgi:hypothetical protein